MFERIEALYQLDVHRHLHDVLAVRLRRYARRLARRLPAAGARILEPARTVEVAYFLRYCLLLNTDRLLWMVRRRVSDLWRQAADEAAKVHHPLDGVVSCFVGLAGNIGERHNHTRYRSPSTGPDASYGASRPQAANAGPTDPREVDRGDHLDTGPVKDADSAALGSNGRASVTVAMTLLNELYAHDQRHLPADCTIQFGSVWDGAIGDANRERALKALEVATLSGLHRALRNGSVWVKQSLTFRGRQRLFIPEQR